MIHLNAKEIFTPEQLAKFETSAMFIQLSEENYEQLTTAAAARLLLPENVGILKGTDGNHYISVSQTILALMVLHHPHAPTAGDALCRMINKELLI